jgi:hypothetical protein
VQDFRATENVQILTNYKQVKKYKMTLTELLNWTTLSANIATIGTLFLAWWYAHIINEKVEKQKNNILKEKEWQVVWADNFLKKAIEFNDTLSSSLSNFSTAHEIQNHKANDSKELFDKSRLDLYKLRELEWDIKNYTLFVNDNQKKMKLNKIQIELMTFLRNLHANVGKVNLEDFRKNQFEYSKLIREIHSELLEIKPIQKTFNYDVNLN